MIVPIELNPHQVADQETIDPYQTFMMMEAGIDPESFKGSVRMCVSPFKKAKRERGEKFGLDFYDNLTDGQLTDSWATGFQSFQIGMHPEGVFLMRFVPQPLTLKDFITTQ